MFSKRNLKRNLIKFMQQPLYGVRVLIKRLKADMSYKKNPAFAPMPEAVTLFLTHRCNLRCKMCGQWGDRGVTRKKEEVSANMSLEDITKIIDDLAGFKPNITLFGGEPLLHKKIIEIVKHIKSRGMHCIMITNGLLLEKYADRLIDAGINELNISIDGPSRIHDEIRGVEGLFNRINQGVRRIVNARKKRTPLINVQTTISEYNYKSLEEMLEVVESMGADSITFHHLIYLSQEDIDITRQKYPDLNPEDWEGFVAKPKIEPQALIESLNKINEAKKKYRFMINIYPNFKPEEIKKYYLNSSWFPDSYKGRCLSPWICAYIFPDGQLRPCLDFAYPFGNLKEESFEEAWNGSKAQEYRLILEKEGMFPVCKRCTEIFRY
ncbi:radical SAM protein [Elusimicrobiota bacterium]